jgi:hypothetical protein
MSVRIVVKNTKRPRVKPQEKTTKNLVKTQVKNTHKNEEQLLSG